MSRSPDVLSSVVKVLARSSFILWASSTSSHDAENAFPPGQMKEVGKRLSRTKEFIIGRAGLVAPAAHREVDHQRSTQDIVPGDEAPVAAVRALIAIIAQQKILAGRDHQFALSHKSR